VRHAYDSDRQTMFEIGHVTEGWHKIEVRAGLSTVLRGIGRVTRLPWRPGCGRSCRTLTTARTLADALALTHCGAHMPQRTLAAALRHALACA
jgi:hypothetical protein